MSESTAEGTDGITAEITAGITDEFMNEMLTRSQPYTLVVLRRGPRYHDTEAPGIIWEHGRRNFELRAAGKLAIVLPVGDEDIAGIGIFARGPDETAAIMADDPAVQAGVLVASFHSARSFAGDSLPDWSAPFRS